jgi:hypothetical protein
MAQAMVEVTSPTTGHSALGSFESKASEPVMMAAICSAWVPEPAARLIAGSGMPNCSKKSPDMQPS